MLKTFSTGICAGIMVGIGGAIYLSCSNKIVGAILFSVALLTICYLGMYLYTGKIGMFAEDVTLKNAIALPVGLIGNWVGATVFGLLFTVAKPGIVEHARILCENKLDLPPLRVVLLGAFCGMLMYSAVKPWAVHKSPFGIFFCIPVFILCGFEHSIADIFYFAAGRVFEPKRVLFLTLVVVGNTLGGMLIPFLMQIGDKKKVKEEQREEQTV